MDLRFQVKDMLVMTTVLAAYYGFVLANTKEYPENFPSLLVYFIVPVFIATFTFRVIQATQTSQRRIEHLEKNLEKNLRKD